MVRAALVEGRALTWAGSACYTELGDLAEVIARLAGEAGRPVKRVRVALTREVVQLRTVHPAPPLKPWDAPKYVSLEAGRLFRKNGVPLVTHGALVQVNKGDRALWAAGASEPLVAAMLSGCAQAGLFVEAVAPAAETLPAAFDIGGGVAEIAVPNGTTTEWLSVGDSGVWRSRWTRGSEPQTGEWVSALRALNGDAVAVAPAYAAAVRLPTLSLLPAGHRAARRKSNRRRLGVVGGIGLALWLLAATVYVTRLSLTYSRATRLLNAFHSAADTALSLRRDLDGGRATLATIAKAQASRSRTLELVSALTSAFPDSVTIISLHVGADGSLRLAGYAPRAAQALAALGHVQGVSDAGFDGVVTQETVPGGGSRDHFGVVAKVARP
jgi:hypothetical protein